MTSKSELKRLCHLDPAAMAERLAKLERVADAAETLRENSAKGWANDAKTTVYAFSPMAFASALDDALRAAGYLPGETG